MDASTLESLIRSLETRSDSLGSWLKLWIACVVIGLLVEIPVVVAEHFHKLGPESNKWRNLFFKLVGPLLIAIGVCGELGVHVKTVGVEGDLRIANHSVVALVNKQAGEATERASKNEKEAAYLRREAARLGKLAEDERLARVQIEEKVAPRRLTLEQVKTVAGRLRSFSGQRISFFAFAGDSEIVAIGDDILKALAGPSSAGWKVTVSVGQYSSLVGSGIVIELLSNVDDPSRAAARALADALRNERLVVAGPQSEPPTVIMSGDLRADPQARIRIVIAKKP